MHSTVLVRWARVFWPLALASAFAVACYDAAKTTSPDATEWAELTVAKVLMRQQITTFGADGKPNGSRSVTIPSPTPVLHYGALQGEAIGGDSTAAGFPRRRVSHFRDSMGRVHSIGLYYDRPGRPPKFVFAFVDGRIEAIMSARYRPQGNGFVRTSSRITMFGPNGKPTAQVDATPDGIARLTPQSRWQHFDAAVALAVRDVATLFLPAPLHAEETGCVSEWTTYGLASAAVAAISISLAGAVSTCFETGVTCALIPDLTAKLSAATVAWSVALDKLTECMERQKTTEEQAADGGGTGTTSGGGGGGDAGGSGSYDGGEGYESVTKTVEQFIDDAIESGNYSCSDNGDYCVYYAT